MDNEILRDSDPTLRRHITVIPPLRNADREGGTREAYCRNVTSLRLVRAQRLKLSIQRMLRRMIFRATSVITTTHMVLHGLTA